MRRWQLLLTCLLALGAAGQDAHAAVAIGGADRYVVSRAFTYLEDRDGRMTLQDILQPSAQAAFRPVPASGHGANFGFTRSAVWLRLALDPAPDTAPDWLLELAYPPLDRLELYSPDPATPGSFRQQVGGDLLPFASRGIPHRNHVLSVRLAPGAETTLYLRLTSEGTVVAPVTLWRPNALWQHDQAGYGLLSLYFGLLIGLLLYNLLLFSSVRDVGYLIYVCFVASMAVTQAALSGLGAQFLWRGWTWMNNVLPAMGASSAAIFGLLFARHFLSSASRMPRVDRFMRLQLVGWTATLVGGLVLPYTVTTWVVTSLAVVSVATGVVVGVDSIRREFAGAQLFFSAWAVLLLGVLTLALHNAGLVPSNALTANSLLIGSALEMVLLSFALADRINVARRFKEKAQARIAAEHAMVEAISQAQRQLQSVLRDREAILDSLQVGLALVVGQRVQWMNGALAAMLGHPPEALTGQPPAAFLVEGESWQALGQEAAGALAATGSCVRRERLRRRNGEVFPVQMSATWLRPGQPQEGLVWSVTDLAGAAGADARLTASVLSDG